MIHGIIHLISFRYLQDMYFVVTAGNTFQDCCPVGIRELETAGGVITILHGNAFHRAVFICDIHAVHGGSVFFCLDVEHVKDRWT